MSNFMAKCTKFDFALEPAYSAPQTPWLDLTGPTSNFLRGGEGKGEKVERGVQGRKGEGRRGERKQKSCRGFHVTPSDAKCVRNPRGG